jgi:hypothetical protein
MSEDNICVETEKVTLWPRFGSKTDSGTYRQSGWELINHQDDDICPVAHVKKMIQLSMKRRRQTQIKNLFISVTGKVRPASRTCIANWIRSIFREVGIDAPPNSIRSAVASRGWLENRPVDEILTRGNWRSFETFRNYYCREVQSVVSNNADLLFDNFKIVA